MVVWTFKELEGKFFRIFNDFYLFVSIFGGKPEVKTQPLKNCPSTIEDTLNTLLLLKYEGQKTSV
jgi:hypothetical protein